MCFGETSGRTPLSRRFPPKPSSTVNPTRPVSVCCADNNGFWDIMLNYRSNFLVFSNCLNNFHVVYEHEIFGFLAITRRFTGSQICLFSFYNWETQTATSNPTPNYQVIAENPSGLLFKNKRDRKILNVDPKVSVQHSFCNLQVAWRSPAENQCPQSSPVQWEGEITFSETIGSDNDGKEVMGRDNMNRESGCLLLPALAWRGKIVMFSNPLSIAPSTPWLERRLHHPWG